MKDVGTTYVGMTDGETISYLYVEGADPDPSYFSHWWGSCSAADAYFRGETKKNECSCLKPGRPWLGESCPNWRPTGAHSIDTMWEVFYWQTYKQGE